MNIDKKIDANRIIVFTSNTSWYLYNFQLLNMLNLQSKGYQIYCISPKDKYSAKLEDNGCKFLNITMQNHGLNPIKDYLTYRQYRKFYKNIKPLIICSFTIKTNIYSTTAAGKLGIKVINNVSGLGTVFVKTNFITKIVIAMYKYAMQYSSHIFFQNKENQQLFCSKVNVKSFSFLPGSGVDTNAFKPIVKTENTGKNEKNKKTTFLLVARLLWEKGIGEYFEAAKKIYEKSNQVCFLLLGELCQGKLCIPKHTIEQWNREPFFQYLGATDNVKQYLAQADCVVLPSYAEGTPRSLLEAASMAKPIVTTDAPGCRNVVDDGITGYLCKLKSVEDLAKKIILFLELSELEKSKMGKMGREKIVKNYDVQLVIKQYQDKVTSLLDNK